MKYRLLLNLDTREEIVDAYEWYERQSVGLGEEFLRALETRLYSIQRNPLMHPVVHRQIRRSLTRKFPYGIFYHIEGSDVVVLACYHLSRKPKKW